MMQYKLPVSLRSYLEFISNWFDYDMNKYNFYLMPISFFHPYEIGSFSVNKQNVQEKNLLKFLKTKERKNPYTENSPHNFSLKMVTAFEKGTTSTGNVKIGKKGVSITISEESLFKNKFNITYDALKVFLKKRYVGFKANQVFNELYSKLKLDEKLCRFNYLDPVKKTGSKKPFFCSEIYKEFDKYYTKI